ncbi:MAG: pterin-4-alpha-carbinolamine dehydratase [Gammaproteobacteria bacterium]|nr:pterin-4-alpha-carbinolamine dehydratase [Gammaproteobacteria bacterium]
MKDNWKERNRPNRLERQYQFEDYELLRDFLDQAAEISEKVDYYPDMGFGRDYVNVTIHAPEDSDDVTDEQRQFAQQLDALFSEKSKEH